MYNFCIIFYKIGVDILKIDYSRIFYCLLSDYKSIILEHSIIKFFFFYFSNIGK